jgi:hypothetical protein
MQIALSDSDIRRWGLNVVIYSDLGGVDDVLRMLPLVILYDENGDGFGHWVLLHRAGKEGHIEFFDPYGAVPDSQSESGGNWYRGEHKLVAILRELSKGHVIEYNQFQFQRLAPGVNVCGRWCIVRHLFANKSIEEFERGVELVCEELNVNGDELVVMVT